MFVCVGVGVGVGVGVLACLRIPCWAFKKKNASQAVKDPLHQLRKGRHISPKYRTPNPRQRSLTCAACTGEVSIPSLLFLAAHLNLHHLHAGCACCCMLCACCCMLCARMGSLRNSN